MSSVPRVLATFVAPIIRWIVILSLAVTLVPSPYPPQERLVFYEALAASAGLPRIIGGLRSIAARLARTITAVAHRLSPPVAGGLA